MPKKLKLYLCVTLVFICTVLGFKVLCDRDAVSASAVGIVDVEGYLNVRKGPGKSYGLLKSGGTNVVLSDGQRVTITAKNGKWYHIKFKQNSKSLKGYVYYTYLNVQTGSTYTSVVANVSVSSVKVRKKATASSAYIKSGSTAIALTKDKKVRIWSETLVKKQKWYYISFSYDSKTYKGYVKAEAVEAQYSKGLPCILNNSAAVTLMEKAGGKTAVEVSKTKVTVSDGRQLTALGESIVSEQKYIYVKLTFNKKTVKGYLPVEYVYWQLVKSESKAKATATPTPKATAKATSTAKATATAKATTTPLSNSAFKKKLQSEGFPSTYITELMKLHEKYPYWEFKAYKTGLKWGTVIKKESTVGLNLLSNSKSYAWKSTASGAYNWKTDAYIPYDGSTWVTASVKAVKYYMDPRNFLDERGIFQFESLEYQSDTQTQAGVEKILYNTPMYKKKFTYTTSAGKSSTMKYSKAFMKAAAKSSVSPYHLASRAKQEVVISSSLMSSSVSGNVSGYKGIFNFYNIGANNSTVSGGAVANGLNWASSGSTYLRPWNTRYKSIVGGAQYIGKNYINVGQNTLYLEKFNVTSKNRYNHQYMGNIEAPNSEATKTVSAYGTLDDDMSITFSIPVYNNMPDTACDVPSGGKNPNNYLKTLYVKDHAFDSKFVLGDNGSKTYTMTVANSVSSIKICATKVSTYSTLTGAGTKSLSVGENSYTVKVRSASGKTRKYNIAVTRKEA